MIHQVLTILIFSPWLTANAKLNRDAPQCRRFQKHDCKVDDLKTNCHELCENKASGMLQRNTGETTTEVPLLSEPQVWTDEMCIAVDDRFCQFDELTVAGCPEICKEIQMLNKTTEIDGEGYWCNLFSSNDCDTILVKEECFKLCANSGITGSAVTRVRNDENNCKEMTAADCSKYELTRMMCPKLCSGLTIIATGDVIVLPAGYMVLNGRKVRVPQLEDGFMRWHEAVERCDQDNGKPFIPVTSQDFNWVTSIVEQLGDDIWLPAMDRNTEGLPQWINGQVVGNLSHMSWMKEQMMNNSHDDRDCLVYGWPTASDKEKLSLYMDNCHDLYRPMICEIF